MIRGGGAPERRAGAEMFCVGEERTASGEFVHVFEERALEVLMENLNTSRDFFDYLNCKEYALRRYHITAGGGEDLLAFYLPKDKTLTPSEGHYDVLNFEFGAYAAGVLSATRVLLLRRGEGKPIHCPRRRRCGCNG